MLVLLSKSLVVTKSYSPRSSHHLFDRLRTDKPAYQSLNHTIPEQYICHMYNLECTAFPSLAEIRNWSVFEIEIKDIEIF